MQRGVVAFIETSFVTAMQILSNVGYESSPGTDEVTHTLEYENSDIQEKQHARMASVHTIAYCRVEY